MGDGLGNVPCLQVWVGSFTYRRHLRHFFYLTQLSLSPVAVAVAVALGTRKLRLCSNGCSCLQSSLLAVDDSTINTDSSLKLLFYFCSYEAAPFNRIASRVKRIKTNT